MKSKTYGYTFWSFEQYCDSVSEDKNEEWPNRPSNTAFDKVVSTVGWNAAILSTNCFLMMYDILENYM